MFLGICVLFTWWAYMLSTKVKEALVERKHILFNFHLQNIRRKFKILITKCVLMISSTILMMGKPRWGVCSFVVWREWDRLTSFISSDCPLSVFDLVISKLRQDTNIHKYVIISHVNLRGETDWHLEKCTIELWTCDL